MSDSPPRTSAGSVLAIYVTDRRGGPPRQVSEVRAVSGRGLEGDRYCTGTGSFSRWPGSGRAVSLIAQESIDAARALGVDLSDGAHRRNIVTVGADLLALNGQRFRIGGALLRGSRECLPCKYLERLAGPGVFAVLRGRGGLRADILEDGLIRPGDLIFPLGSRARIVEEI